MIDAKEGINNFIESSPDEKAYILGGVTENIAVTVATSKAVNVANSKIRAAAREARGSATGHCFIEGTFIFTENGLVAIEEIKLCILENILFKQRNSIET